ncbi:hypothetical protein LCGC14_2096190 [marine sediment metagenome]|uniref:Uncharacterized protein n=1 Tax=marine sediment metagenome TaxID=412755 RepID=A0A0F9EBA9_9ZZZZ
MNGWRRLNNISCHPDHTTTQEDLDEERLQQDRKADAIDPRKIQRNWRWRLGHDPSDQDDHHDPNVAYLNIEHVGPETRPDQRDRLSGGPESGVPCHICGEGTRVCGSISQWDSYQDPKVDIVNLSEISEERKKELQETILVILCCPKCNNKQQWLEDALPVVNK